MFKKFVILISLALWPVNLILTNSLYNFVLFAFPAGLLLLSYFLYKRYRKFYLIPLVFIGIIQINLLPFSIIFCVLDLICRPEKRINTISLIATVASIVVFVSFFAGFQKNTIFNRDLESEQTIENNTQFYPNRFLAKLFQNGPRIYFDKLTTNFFNLLEPDGYFFGFYPTGLGNKIHIIKFSFLAAPFLFFGFLNLKKHSHKRFVYISFTAGIVCLILLNNFAGYDFILSVPAGLVLSDGIKYMSEKHSKIFFLLSIFLIIYSFPEFFRNFR